MKGLVKDFLRKDQCAFYPGIIITNINVAIAKLVCEGYFPPIMEKVN